MLIAAGSATLVGPLLAGSASAEPSEPGLAAVGPESTAEPNPFTPKRQFRAMWIATVLRLDWPSPGAIEAMKAEYEQMLDFAVATNQNAVIVQVRPTADSFWPGALEPWSRYLTGAPGQDPGWDPLAFLVEAAHARNLEFHAWFNPYRVSMPASATEAGVDITKLAPNHPVRNNPNWVIPYPINNAAGRLYYDPGIPEVRRFCEDAVLDAVVKYDIDGVHFDDYFYPYPVPHEPFPDHETFARYGAGFSDLDDWRRSNVNYFVHEVSQQVAAVKPWVRFGISPFGIWRNRTIDPAGSDTTGFQSYDEIYADTRLWVQNGWLDYIAPQLYWKMDDSKAAYTHLLPWWTKTTAGTGTALYIGQAAYRLNPTAADPVWRDPTELLIHMGAAISGSTPPTSLPARRICPKRWPPTSTADRPWSPSRPGSPVLRHPRPATFTRMHPLEKWRSPGPALSRGPLGITRYTASMAKSRRGRNPSMTPAISWGPPAQVSNHRAMPIPLVILVSPIPMRLPR
jgi:uncharacterized lipoprotein YddW (UPF0748 family)